MATEQTLPAVFKLTGDLDMARLAELDEIAAAVVQLGFSIVDLTEVTFVDSTAVNWLLRTKQVVEEKSGRIRVVTPRNGYKAGFDHRSRRDNRSISNPTRGAGRLTNGRPLTPGTSVDPAGVTGAQYRDPRSCSPMPESISSRPGLSRQVLVLHLPGVVQHMEGAVADKERQIPRTHSFSFAGVVGPHRRDKRLSMGSQALRS